MKKLIPGMFSSVPDAELLLAMTDYEEDAPENVADKFGGFGGVDSQAGAEINSSPAANDSVD